MVRPYQGLPPDPEVRMTLAIQAINSGQSRSLREAAAVHDVPRSTLRNRMDGRVSRRDCTPNSQKLTPKEEQIIVQHIFDLDSRGESPRPQHIQEMADTLLTQRDAAPVGKNWKTNFIRRHPEVRSKFRLKSDGSKVQRRKLERTPKILPGVEEELEDLVKRFRDLVQGMGDVPALVNEVFDQLVKKSQVIAQSNKALKAEVKALKAIYVDDEHGDRNRKRRAIKKGSPSIDEGGEKQESTQARQEEENILHQQQTQGTQ